MIKDIKLNMPLFLNDNQGKNYKYILHKNNKDMMVMDYNDRIRKIKASNLKTEKEKEKMLNGLIVKSKVDRVLDDRLYIVDGKTEYKNNIKQITLNKELKDATLWSIKHKFNNDNKGIIAINDNNEIELYKGRLQFGELDENPDILKVNSLDSDENLTEINRIGEKDGLLKTDKGNVILFDHDILDFSHKIPEEDYIYIDDSVFDSFKERYGEYDKQTMMDKRLLTNKLSNNKFKMDLAQEGLVDSFKIKC